MSERNTGCDGSDGPKYDTDRIRADFAALGDEGSWYGWIPAPIHDLYGAEQLSDEEAIELARRDGSLEKYRIPGTGNSYSHPSFTTSYYSDGGSAYCDGDSAHSGGDSTGSGGGSVAPQRDVDSISGSASAYGAAGKNDQLNPKPFIIGAIAIVLIVVVILLAAVVSSITSYTDSASNEDSAAYTSYSAKAPGSQSDSGSSASGGSVAADESQTAGSGTAVENSNAGASSASSGTAYASLPDVNDYDDPSLFADDAEDYFAEQGSSDPWQEAYAYWEKNR